MLRRPDRRIPASSTGCAPPPSTARDSRSGRFVALAVADDTSTVRPSTGCPHRRPQDGRRLRPASGDEIAKPLVLSRIRAATVPLTPARRGGEAVGETRRRTFLGSTADRSGHRRATPHGATRAAAPMTRRRVRRTRSGGAAGACIPVTSVTGWAGSRGGVIPRPLGRSACRQPDVAALANHEAPPSHTWRGLVLVYTLRRCSPGTRRGASPIRSARHARSRPPCAAGRRLGQARCSCTRPVTRSVTRSVTRPVTGRWPDCCWPPVAGSGWVGPRPWCPAGPGCRGS